MIGYSFIISIVLFSLSFIGLFFTEKNESMTISYIILSFSIIPLCLYIGYSNILESINLEKKVLFITASSSVINLVLNYILIYFLDDSAVAVSLSTLIVRIILIISVYILIIKTGFIANPIFSKDICYKLFNFGKSEALTSLIFTGGIALLVIYFSHNLLFEDVVYLGFSLNFMNTFSVIYVGLAISLSITLSQNRQGFKETRSLIYQSCIYILISSILLLLISGGMSTIYTNDYNAKLSLSIQVSVAVIAFDGLAMMLISTLRVQGFIQTPPLFRLSLIIIGIPFSFFFKAYNDPVLNVVVFMALGNLIAAILAFTYFLRVSVIKLDEKPNLLQ